MRKKAATGLLCFFLSIQILSISVQAAERGPLLFVGDESYPPLTYLENNEPKGIIIDVVRAIEKRLNRPIAIRLMNWQQAQDLVINGEADFLCPMSVTEERKLLYDFSVPVLDLRYSIFVRSGKMGIENMEDLRGLQVGVTAGGLPRKLVAADPRIRMVIVEDSLRGFKQLEARKIDAVIADQWVGTYLLAELGIADIQPSGKPVSRLTAAIAVKKGNSALLQSINDCFSSLWNDGTIDRINQAWQPKEIIVQTREQSTRKNLTVAVGILFLLLVLSVVWIFTMKREINRRRKAESTLRESENHHRAILFTAMDGFLYTDFNGSVLEVNETYCRMSGYSAKELTVMNAADLEVNESKINIAERIHTIIEQGEARFETRQRRKDGLVFDVEVSIQYQPIGGGRFINFLRDITERKTAEAKIVQSLREKETLLRELYHRTKNTMQVIRSMLVLQASEFTQNSELQKVVKDTEQRIQAISLVHQMLYKANNLSQISIREYVEELSSLILQSSVLSKDKVRIDIKIDDQNFLLDTAIPFGIIINELIVNSLKHAFQGVADGAISISLERVNDEKNVFCYSDNGVGVPDRFDFRNQNSLGLKLIYSIGEQQMNGTVVMDNDHGVKCRFEFSNTSYKERV